jgi:hypothetical protein
MSRWSSNEVRATSQRLVIGSCAVLAALFGSGISSCLQSAGGRSATLRHAAEQLIPDGARIRARVVKSDNAQGGWSLFLRRSGYTAFVVLWRPEVYNLTCKAVQRDEKCFNTVNLERSS